MARIILQPAGDIEAKKHYEDTVAKPVPISRIASVVQPTDLQILSDLYPDGLLPTWGVTPGENDVNVAKWKRIRPGDVALFCRAGGVFSSGVVTHRARNQALALDLWGWKKLRPQLRKPVPRSQTWEYMYFLTDLRPRSLPYKKLNAAAGYEDTNVIQGFSVLDERKSEDIISALDIEYEPAHLDVSQDEFEQAVRDFDPSKPLDAIGRARRRIEQGFLRKFLFGRKSLGGCGICGRSLPTELLIAAHIKPRSECTTAERLAYKQNVMPMCKFGCDDLFERGYITVGGGVVVVRARRLQQIPEPTRQEVAGLAGRPCAHWTAGEVYFKWHNHHHGLTEE